ncbi:MAG: polyhydroxyalkanoate synthesis regulator DNA-binding domain-containing protein [Deltaproteobacteria bacterium]
MAEQIVIKKYSNRRLYDTVHKKYVTFEEISALIRDGAEVKVLDSQTDEDITKLILIQAILESEKNKVDILPASFLHMLIKYGNKVAKDFFENYFLMMFQPYVSIQESMKQNLNLWQNIGMLSSALKFPQVSPVMKNPFEAFRGEMEARAETEKQSEPPPSTQFMEIEFLNRRIKELEDKISAINPPPPRPPKARYKSKKAV